MSQPMPVPQLQPAATSGTTCTTISNDSSQPSAAAQQKVPSQQPVQPQLVLLTDQDILKSIENEMRATNFKQQGLTEKVGKYHVELDNLKKDLQRRKRKIAILDMILTADAADWKTPLQDLMHKAEFDFNTYSETYMQRMHHEQQLDIVEGQHENLKAMAEHLGARLKKVVQEYQSLNAPMEQGNTFGHMLNPDGAMAISNNTHFKDLVA